MGAVVNYLVQDVLGAAMPENWQKGRPMTVGELLDHAGATIGERFQGQPLVEARCRMALAELLYVRDNERSVEHAERAVALLSPLLGPDHPETLRARGILVSGLAINWQDREVLEEVIRLERPLLTARRRVLGPTHPDTLDSMTELADHLTHYGALDEAEPLARAPMPTRCVPSGPGIPSRSRPSGTGPSWPGRRASSPGPRP